MKLLRLMRPLQWAKNVLLFAAPIFAQRFSRMEDIRTTLLAFLCFCAIASAGYIANDFRDREQDQLHPTKRNRPLASGAVSAPTALLLALALLLGGLGLSWQILPAFTYCLLGYLALTWSYTLVFKHIVIVDVLAIAAGFVLRAISGGVAIEVPLSPWFLVCVGFLALYIALSKRRAELGLLSEGAVSHRSTLGQYEKETLDRMASMIGTCAILGYALYTVEASPSPWLMITLPMVVAGVMRYEILVDRGQGGEPERVWLQDPALLATVLLCGATIVAVLWLS